MTEKEHMQLHHGKTLEEKKYNKLIWARNHSDDLNKRKRDARKDIKKRKKILSTEKRYREENKKRIRDSQRQWREKNKNKVNRQSNNYYYRNRERLLEEMRIRRETKKYKYSR